MTSSPRRGLAIGIGNALRADDGLGAQVVERLEASAMHEAQAVHQLVPELALRIAAFDRVAFVDAALNASPGEIGERDVRAGPGAPRLGHALSIEALLALTEELGDRAPRARLFTVGGESFAHGVGLTPRVKAAVAEVAERVGTWLTDARVRSGLIEGYGDERPVSAEYRRRD